MKYKIKALLIHNIISPYRVPLFNEIAKNNNLQFKVIFLAKTEKGREWHIPKEINFNYILLPNFYLKVGQRHIRFNPTLWFELKRFNPDVLVTGGFSIASIIAFTYGKILNKPVIIWNEGNPDTEKIHHPLIHKYRRFMVKNASAFLVPGKPAAEYLKAIGARENIFLMPNPVDVQLYESKLQEKGKILTDLQLKYNFGDKKILFVGRLVDRKGLNHLLEAYSVIFSRHKDVSLIILGDGDKRKVYEKFCRENRLSKVFFMGFLQQEEIAKFFAISDVFVLPTIYDYAPLVVSEAIASEIPIVCSDKAGSACDLIESGRNGYIINPYDHKRMAELIEKILFDQKLNIKMSAYNRKTKYRISTKYAAEIFMHMLKKTASIRQE